MLILLHLLLNYNQYPLKFHLQHLVVGGEYIVKAQYKRDKKYGDQYTPIAIYAVIPQTREMQLLFLKSMISKNIAEKLINAYPNVVNDVAFYLLTYLFLHSYLNGFL